MPLASPPAVGRLQLLEGFAFEWHGSPVPLPHGSQRLVALLGLSDDALSRIRVADLLWDDQSAARASGSLRTLVWRLRQQCPGLLVEDHGGLRLQDGIDVDVSRLRTEAVRWRALANDRAGRIDVPPDDLHAFRTPKSLLPGWYDDFVLLHRERLSAIRVDLLTDAAEVLLAAGRAALALDFALSAVAAEPFDERLHMLVARIHLAQGNGWEAVRQYRLCAELFRSELGTRPTPAFTRLLPVDPGLPPPRRRGVRPTTRVRRSVRP